MDSSGSVVAVLTSECTEPDATRPFPQSTSVGGGPSMARKRRRATNPVLVGAPVGALRAFILKAGTGAERGSATLEVAPTPETGHAVAARTSPPPWLGIRGEAYRGATVHGVRVVAVAPSSPAERAGLRADVDMIASVDGTPVDAPEKLAEIIASRAAGDTIQLLVLSGGQLRTIQVVLMRQE